jgi:hypothetical protein
LTRALSCSKPDKAVTRASFNRASDHGSRPLGSQDQLAASLGPFYNKRVVITAEETTRWSINTGRETRRYRMLGINIGDTAEVEHGPGTAPLGDLLE